MSLEFMQKFYENKFDFDRLLRFRLFMEQNAIVDLSLFKKAMASFPASFKKDLGESLIAADPTYSPLELDIVAFLVNECGADVNVCRQTTPLYSAVHRSEERRVGKELR